MSFEDDFATSSKEPEINLFEVVDGPTFDSGAFDDDEEHVQRLMSEQGGAEERIEDSYHQVEQNDEQGREVVSSIEDPESFERKHAA